MNRKIKSWIEAMRLHTLPVSIAGVLAGTAVAVAYLDYKPLPAAICLVFAMLAQIASNFANEYYDYRYGLDKKGREGFRRGVTEGDLTPGAMKAATFLTLGLACAAGLSLIYWGGWWLLLPGMLIALFALAYSTGPYPLSHHGLGEAAVVVFFGLVPVSLTAYVQAGPLAAFSAESFCIGAGIGLMTANVLIMNNYRDTEDDRKVGKRTLAVRFGPRVMSFLYLFCGLTGVALIAYGTFLCADFSATSHARIGSRAIFTFLIIAVAVVALYRDMQKKQGAGLNALLGKTAKLVLLTSLFTLVIILICNF